MQYGLSKLIKAVDVQLDQPVHDVDVVINMMCTDFYGELKTINNRNSPGL